MLPPQRPRERCAPPRGGALPAEAHGRTQGSPGWSRREPRGAAYHRCHARAAWRSEVAFARPSRARLVFTCAHYITLREEHVQGQPHRVHGGGEREGILRRRELERPADSRHGAVTICKFRHVFTETGGLRSRRSEVRILCGALKLNASRVGRATTEDSLGGGRAPRRQNECGQAIPVHVRSCRDFDLLPSSDM